MLHVTNGDAAANVLSGCGLQGDILPWREVWTDGPARALWDAEDALAERADYLHRTLGIPQHVFLDNGRSQIGRLREAVRQAEEIVLWFEYDLFDQAMLASLLDGLSRWHDAEGMTLKLSMITAESVEGVDDFRGLGQLTPEQLRGLWPQRRDISEAELSAGRRAWRAFASPDPASVEAWIRLEGTRQLPVMAKAMAFHLRRFPSVTDGLGAAERATLAALKQSAVRPDRLFGRVSAQLPGYGLGDLSYWAYLNRMAGAGLIQIDGGGDSLPVYSNDGPMDWEQWSVRLAEPGRAAFPGRAADGAAFSPLYDRWLGGVPPQTGTGAKWQASGADADTDGVPEMLLR